VTFSDIIFPPSFFFFFFPFLARAQPNRRTPFLPLHLSVNRVVNAGCPLSTTNLSDDGSSGPLLPPSFFPVEHNQRPLYSVRDAQQYLLSIEASLSERRWTPFPPSLPPLWRESGGRVISSPFTYHTDEPVISPSPACCSVTKYRSFPLLRDNASRLPPFLLLPVHP